MERVWWRQNARRTRDRTIRMVAKDVAVKCQGDNNETTGESERVTTTSFRND